MCRPATANEKMDVAVRREGMLHRCANNHGDEMKGEEKKFL